MRVRIARECRAVGDYFTREQTRAFALSLRDRFGAAWPMLGAPLRAAAIDSEAFAAVRTQHATQIDTCMLNLLRAAIAHAIDSED